MLRPAPQAAIDEFARIIGVFAKGTFLPVGNHFKSKAQNPNSAADPKENVYWHALTRADDHDRSRRGDYRPYRLQCPSHQKAGRVDLYLIKALINPANRMDPIV